MQLITKTKKWGTSMVIVIPAEYVDIMKLDEGETLRVELQRWIEEIKGE